VLLQDTTFETPKFFCCKGCQGVYHLLKDEGLDTFYAKMGDETTLEPPKVNLDDTSRFDLDGFISKYVKINKEGLNEIALIIEGIHCSACVWLNEKVLSKQEGIVEVSINYTNHKAKIVWDGAVIKLSQIIETIRSIGYNAYPYDPKSGEERATAQRREYYSKLLVGVFATMNVMWIAIAQYAGYFTGMESNIKSILNFAEFILATPTLFYTGSIYFKGAYYGIKHRYITMDFLVATGATLTYVFSLYAMFTRSAEVYFDSVTMTKRWLAVLGDMGYDLLLNVNQILNWWRKTLRYQSHWSLSKYVKDHVKSSVSFITDFESILSEHAKRHHFDGVICGHIHKAEMREIDGIKYLNCGDWVESCTAIVETYEGEFRIIRWLGH